MATTTIDISIDPAQEREVRELLGGIRNGYERAATVAVNRTLTTGRSRVAKRLTKIINLKAGSASDPQPDTINSFLGVRKANWDTLSGALIITRKEIPLSKFDPQQRPGGVSVKIRKERGRELIKDAFVAKLKSGHVGVFRRAKSIAFDSLAEPQQRYYKAGVLHFRVSRLVTFKSNSRVARLPIEETFGGATPLGVFENAPGLSAEVLGELGQVLLKNLESQTERLLNPRKNDATQGDGKGADAGGDS